MRIVHWRIILLTVFLSPYLVVGQTLIVKELVYSDSYLIKNGSRYGISSDVKNAECVYDSIEISWDETYSFVEKAGLWGVLDAKHDVKIDCEYDYIEIACCYEKVKTGKDNFIVKSNSKYGLIDHLGGVVIPIEYDAITNWVEYGPDAHYVMKNNKIGLIEHGGNTMIPVKYDSLYFKRGFVKAKLNNKFGLLNSKNEMIVPFEFDALILDFKIYLLAGVSHKNRIIARKGGQWSSFDLKGNMLKDKVLDRELRAQFGSHTFQNYDFEYIGHMFIR